MDEIKEVLLTSIYGLLVAVIPLITGFVVAFVKK